MGYYMMGYDGIGWDRMWQDGIGWDTMGWDGMGLNGMEWDSTEQDRIPLFHLDSLFIKLHLFNMVQIIVH